MLELYQAEWCPASRRVRQRLTELDVAYIVRQVPVERNERIALMSETGADTVPALVVDDGGALVGEEQILAHLDARFEEPLGATAHRVKAQKVRKREMKEAARCLEPSTP